MKPKLTIISHSPYPRSKRVKGQGTAPNELMLLGEAPGREENLTGVPFIGRAGKCLNLALDTVDLPRASIYVTNVVPYRPPNNRVPTFKEILKCRRYLISDLHRVQPKRILCMGITAFRGLFKSPTSETIAYMRRYTYRLKINHFHLTSVYVTYHPSATLRNPPLFKLFIEDLKKFKRGAI